MSDTKSFESMMDTLLNGFTYDVRTDELSGSYKMIAARLDRLKAAHDREIRDVSQQQYDRGFHDGQHSMDAEHRAVAMRLRALPLDGGSHENLSQIARAIYHSDFGWTQGACMSLRDEMVRLMGGVSDGTCGSQCCGACAAGDGGDSGEQVEVGDGRTGAIGVTEPVGCNDERGDDCGGGDSGESEVTDERLADDSGADTGCGDGGGDLHLAGVTYDVLWNERHKAVCELKKMPNGYPEYASAPFAKWYAEFCEALGVETGFGNVRDRLIHLLGGDQPSGIDVLRAMDTDGTSHNEVGTCPNDDPTSSITDELREWMSTVLTSDDYAWAIADRIDEQFERICQQQEAVLQETIDGMVDERDHWKQVAVTNTTALLGISGENASLKADCEKLERQRDHWRQQTTDMMNHADAMEHERDELQEKLDWYDKTHVELPKDANGDVFRVGCTVRMVERHPDVLLTAHSMTLCDDGEWLLYAYDDEEKYSCNLSTSEFEMHDMPRDTAESIVRDLSIGAVTESEAIKRIEALNG